MHRKKKFINIYLYFILGLFTLVAVCLGVTYKLNTVTEIHQTGVYVEEPTKPTYTMSEEQIPAIMEGDQGELIEVYEIPTMEEVDGGLFKDKDTGVSTVEGEYEDLGWSETYNVSSPEAFKNDTLNRCIIANNYYGAQCVSLARVFWWSYADRDVSTCGTGMAKGMMNCYEENAGDDFLVFWGEDKNEIQAGDWLIFTGGQYGHVGMALGPVVNGYVALLGENQGGRYCEGGGAATNIININIKNLIGFYRPKAYIIPEPTPEPNKCEKREVYWGDTLGKIMEECLGEIKWNEMDDYAKHWYSVKIKKFNTVYDGWKSKTGYGLFAEDIIEYR
jgi:hypothetical protein